MGTSSFEKKHLSMQYSEKMAKVIGLRLQTYFTGNKDIKYF